MLHPLHLASSTFAAVSLVLFQSSHAWAATLFLGNSSGTFESPLVDQSVDPEATFSTEKPNPQSETFVMGRPDNSSIPNKLTFWSNSFAAIPEQAFAVGNLTYLNGQTFTGTHVSSVPLSIQLNLAEPAQAQRRFKYTFGFDLTPNTDLNGSADNLLVSDNPQAQTFKFDQKLYSLALLGFSPDGGATFSRIFEVPEDKTISSTLYAQIKLASPQHLSGQPPVMPLPPEMPPETPSETPVKVPEPAAVAGLMLLSGALFSKRQATRDRTVATTHCQ